MAKKKKAATKIVDRFLSPQSSNVEGGTYEPDSGYTVLAFRDKKDPQALTSYYYYEKVTANDWYNLLMAPSKGKHVREVFRKKYKGVKIEQH